jgi:hypothetical protein
LLVGIAFIASVRQVAQANTIAVEMGTPLRFKCRLVVRGCPAITPCLALFH